MYLSVTVLDTEDLVNRSSGDACGFELFLAGVSCLALWCLSQGQSAESVMDGNYPL